MEEREKTACNALNYLHMNETTGKLINKIITQSEDGITGNPHLHS